MSPALSEAQCYIQCVKPNAVLEIFDEIIFYFYMYLHHNAIQQKDVYISKIMCTMQVVQLFPC